MITTKENGTQYMELNNNIVKFHDDNNLTLAYVTRPLTYNKDGDYVDDITTEEVKSGTQLKLLLIDKEYNSDRSWREYVISNPEQFSAQAVARIQEAEDKASTLRNRLNSM
jgi:hypothetical protein